MTIVETDQFLTSTDQHTPEERMNVSAVNPGTATLHLPDTLFFWSQLADGRQAGHNQATARHFYDKRVYRQGESHAANFQITCLKSSFPA